MQTKSLSQALNIWNIPNSKMKWKCSQVFLTTNESIWEFLTPHVRKSSLDVDLEFGTGFNFLALYHEFLSQPTQIAIIKLINKSI